MLGLLNLWPMGIFFFAFLSSADFFQNKIFPKILSGIPSECQTDWIQIRPDILSGLIRVQTVCKNYQQTTLVGRVNVSFGEVDMDTALASLKPMCMPFNFGVDGIVLSDRKKCALASKEKLYMYS